MRWHQRAQAGGVAAYEITHGDHGWHPHAHCLMDSRWFSVSEPCPRIGSSAKTWKAAGKRSASELAQQWSLVMGRRGSIKVSRVWTRDGGIEQAVREVIKYATKGSDLAGLDIPIAPLIDEIDRTRLVTSWGSFYRHPACKRQRGGCTPCGCGCTEWLPEDVLNRQARGEHGY
jgi:hypothetical protein